MKDKEFYVELKMKKGKKSGDFIVMLFDLTQIKNLERLNKKYRNTYFAKIAHELRTPLNSISPLSERLL